MKFSVAFSRTGSFRKVEAAYTFGEFPNLKEFLEMRNRDALRIKMEGFDDAFLTKAHRKLDNLTSGFKVAGAYVVMCPELLDPTEMPVYVSIKFVQP